MARHFVYGLLLFLGFFLGFVIGKAQTPRAPFGGKAKIELGDRQLQRGPETRTARGPAEAIKRTEDLDSNQEKNISRYSTSAETEPQELPIPPHEMAGIEDALDTSQEDEKALERLSHLNALSPAERQALLKEEFVSSLAKNGVPAEDIEAMVKFLVETPEEPDKKLELLEIPPFPPNHPNQ